MLKTNFPLLLKNKSFLNNMYIRNGRSQYYRKISFLHFLCCKISHLHIFHSNEQLYCLFLCVWYLHSGISFRILLELKRLFLFFEKNLSTSFPPKIFINCPSYNIRYTPVCSVLLFQEHFFLFFGKSDADGFGLWVWFHEHFSFLGRPSVILGVFSASSIDIPLCKYL